jgi:hypothetical protein
MLVACRLAGLSALETHYVQHPRARAITGARRSLVGASELAQDARRALWRCRDSGESLKAATGLPIGSPRTRGPPRGEYAARSHPRPGPRMVNRGQTRPRRRTPRGRRTVGDHELAENCQT